MIEVIDTLEKFDALKTDWERLEANPQMRIQQTFLWNRESWPTIEDPHKRLWILKWTQDGRDDVVLCPLYIDGKHTLRFINDKHNDHCDSVYGVAHLNRYRAYKEIAEAIMAEPTIKSVWLQKMYGEGEAMHYLGVFLPGAITTRDNTYAWIEVNEPGEFLASQSHLKSEEKKHLRKTIKKAMAFDFAIRSKANGDVFPKDDIQGLRKEMVASGMRKDGFFLDGWLVLLEKLFSVGQCEVIEASVDGKIRALQIHIIKDNRNQGWLYLGMEQHFGSELYARFCDEWSKTHSGIIDFGVGTYDYKMRTFRPFVGVTCSIRMGKTHYQHFKQAIAMNMRFLKNYLKDTVLKKKENG